MSTQIAPYIPDDAPFTQEQRAWLNGFLAGIFSRQGTPTIAQTIGKKTVAILYGSQSGNTESLAKKLAKDFEKKNFNPKVVDMESYTVSKLAEEETVLIMTSTYGDGEPPDNARSLYDALHAEQSNMLSKVRFAVLGLGDSKYPDFNKCARQFEERLLALGGQKITSGVFCDTDYEADFQKWKEALFVAIAEESDPVITSTGSVDIVSDHDEEKYGKHNPYHATIKANQLLTHPNSTKETRHVEFSMEGSGMCYECGDALAVLPQNCPETVQQILDILKENSTTLVTTVHGKELELGECLLSEVEIGFVTPMFLRTYSDFANNEALKIMVEQPVSEVKSALEGMQLADLLKEYPMKGKSAAELVRLLRPIQQRLYSISSSPKAHPDTIHLTMGIVRHITANGVREGICTGYIARQAIGATAKVYVHRNNAFKLPADSTQPLIMVGPGTGIAPFRGFLQERAATNASGKNWLFFGERTSTQEYLYRSELEQWFSSGLLTRFSTAFSRDQEKKIYVQDRMLEHGAELFQWLEEGAAFYVCGDASRMAKDVDAALHKLIATHSGKGDAYAVDYIKEMRSSRRYLRDVY